MIPRLMPAAIFLRRLSLLLLALLPPAGRAQSTEVAVPVPADSRIAVTQVRVVPDRASWTYALGEPVRFRVAVTWDEQPLPGAKVKVSVGPEWQPGREFTAEVPAAGLVVDGGAMSEPGFIRCLVTTEVAGRTYRGLATAGVAPEKIRPTQAQPEDFDAFWSAGKEALAKIPLDTVMTLVPDKCTDKVNVYHVSYRTFGVIPSAKPRVFGMYCEPRAPGKYPALLFVPGAGVGSQPGLVDLAARGFITLQIGIHGIPLDLPADAYDRLGQGALTAYPFMFLDNRDLYYFRRVYLGCVRSNDFLVSRENWDGKNLFVTGRSQGGQLAIVTAGLDPRVTGVAAIYPAYCDVTGYLHGRAGGWPHMFREENAVHRTPEKIATTGYYDSVNFARRIKAPGIYLWGYNDEACPPTSMFAAFNVITAPKRLVLALEMGHVRLPAEQAGLIDDWFVAHSTAP
jgi:cephalosporin-C deacetylase-like acetyl esterase